MALNLTKVRFYAELNRTRPVPATRKARTYRRAHGMYVERNVYFLHNEAQYIAFKRGKV